MRYAVIISLFIMQCIIAAPTYGNSDNKANSSQKKSTTEAHNTPAENNINTKDNSNGAFLQDREIIINPESKGMLKTIKSSLYISGGVGAAWQQNNWNINNVTRNKTQVGMEETQYASFAPTMSIGYQFQYRKFFLTTEMFFTYIASTPQSKIYGLTNRQEVKDYAKFYNNAKKTDDKYDKNSIVDVIDRSSASEANGYITTLRNNPNDAIALQGLNKTVKDLTGNDREKITRLLKDNKDIPEYQSRVNDALQRLNDLDEAWKNITTDGSLNASQNQINAVLYQINAIITDPTMDLLRNYFKNLENSGNSGAGREDGLPFGSGLQMIYGLRLKPGMYLTDKLAINFTIGAVGGLFTRIIAFRNTATDIAGQINPVYSSNEMTINRFGLEAGAGIGYYVNHNLSVHLDLSYIHFFALNQGNSPTMAQAPKQIQSLGGLPTITQPMYDASQGMHVITCILSFRYYIL